MSSRPILVISHDVVGRHLAGPGIRAWHLARVLAGHRPVILAVPGPDRPAVPAERPPFDVWPYQPGDWSTLAPAAQHAAAILVAGDSLVQFPALEHLHIPLIVDGYDPHTLETLALWAAEDSAVQAANHGQRLEVVRRQCRAADFLICASDRQRDWWLGVLEAEGRINPHTYRDDPSLRRLVDLVPFGLPADPPRPASAAPVVRGVWPGVGPDDWIVLWGGGLWEWLDPLTAVRAVHRLAGDGYPVRLIFPGTRHPNPALPDMPMRGRAVSLAEELGLAGRHVFFGDWVAHEDWPAVLCESDVGLSLHPDTVEARLAYRTRVLDYVWAGLPMVVTRGDAAAELVARHDLGHVVGYGDDDAVARALAGLFALAEGRGRAAPATAAGCRANLRAAYRARFDAARPLLTWEQAAAPLVVFCREPRLAPDRAATLDGLGSRGPRGAAGAAGPPQAKPGPGAGRRILLITNYFPPHYTGGAEVVVYNSCLGLRQRGVDASVLMINARMTQGQDVWRDMEGVPVHEMTFRPHVLHSRFLQAFDPRVYNAVLKELRRCRPALVHIHNVSGTSLAVFAACAHLDIPVVSTLHDQWLLCPNNMLYRADGSLCPAATPPQSCRHCFSRYDFWADIPYRRAVFARLVRSVRLFISPSQHLIDLHAAAGYDRGRFRLVRNGLRPGAPTESTDPRVQACARHGGGDHKLLFAGAVAEVKGIEVLVQALHILSRYLDRLWVIVAGDGDERLMALLRRQDSAVLTTLGRVHFQEMRTLYAIADLTVVPSLWYENSPMTIAESMLAGTPAVASAIGGIPELIREGQTGYLFERGDAAGLAAQVLAHLALPAVERRAMRRQCVEYARTHLTLDLHLDALQAVYEEVLEA